MYYPLVILEIVSDCFSFCFIELIHHKFHLLKNCFLFAHVWCTSRSNRYILNSLNKFALTCAILVGSFCIQLWVMLFLAASRQIWVQSPIGFFIRLLRASGLVKMFSRHR